MFKKKSGSTKQDILKEIKIILTKDINAPARSVFERIEKFLVPQPKAGSFIGGSIGYVHIDESRQAEYLDWEKNIKREWLVIIEEIRTGIKKEQKQDICLKTGAGGGIMKRSGAGQSLLEYIIVFSIVVGIVVVVAGMLKPKVQKSYNTLATNISNKLQ